MNDHQVIERIKSEANIAPKAIPLDKEELEAAGIDLDSLPIASAAIDDANLQFCTTLNYPQKAASINTIDSFNNQSKSTGSNEEKQKELHIERIKPQNLTASDTTPSTAKPHSLLKPAEKFNLFLSASITLLAVISVIAMLVCAVLLFFDREQKLYLMGPAAAILFGFAYLVFASKTKCCVCFQKQFVKNRSSKKSNAHHIPLLGYVIPTCLSIVFRGWYRCMICGTEIGVYRDK